MATAETPFPASPSSDKHLLESRQVVLAESSNEFFLAVVGHAGSGTSVVAEALGDLLAQIKIAGSPVHVEIIKARDVIEAWAKERGLAVPLRQDRRSLADVRKLQDYGDQMREGELSAIARGLILQIRARRAANMGVVPGDAAVRPDGKPRAYIMDALRHPAEVELLRHLYRDAFVLIGVVCEEQKRIGRISKKYEDAGETMALDFMRRDADAKERHGQHVADAFHLSDYFVDNTVDRLTREGRPNSDWDVTENLSRLVKLISHAELIRPTIAETAMYHAHTVQMRSACLSRQVGAAIVDASGNVVATGTNEVPKAGGGVYGQSFGPDENDARCAMFQSTADRYCRNTRQQNEIIKELLEAIPELKAADEKRRASLTEDLRKTRIGQLLEFSRAVHAEMDALLAAARKGTSVKGTRLFVTTFPCHYCARHIVAAGVDEVQYIEPYPKSQAIELHKDAIAVEHSSEWKPPSQSPGEGRVLFRPFSGAAPRLYKRAFLKDRALKDPRTGDMQLQSPPWGDPWHLSRVSYPELEAKLSCEGGSNG